MRYPTLISNRRNVKTPLSVYNASKSTILGYAVDVSPTTLILQSPIDIVLSNYTTLWLEVIDSANANTKKYIRVVAHSKAPWKKPNSVGASFTELEIVAMDPAEIITLQQQVANDQSFS